MDVAMIVGVLVLLSLIGFRPLARWFTRRTGTRVVTVKPTAQAPRPKRPAQPS